MARDYLKGELHELKTELHELKTYVAEVRNQLLIAMIVVASAALGIAKVWV
jgi:hypothetical protein